MKSPTPLLTSIGLLIVWGLMIFSFHALLDQAKDFKAEVHPLAMVCLYALHLGRGLAFPAFVVVIAVLMALRLSASRTIALALCLVCDVMFIAVTLNSISLTNSLRGGDSVLVAGVHNLTAPSLLIFVVPQFYVPLVPALIAFLINQALMAVLITRRQEFCR